ncbi:hypothetical protein [Tsukamurella tyrosinosolvens]|uniref:hypothetical protein n=1 Tax=Tsukamurella tyrosinosolvens TaxID=57704 RepID=UPI000792DCB4|nr:hypothetical protein [Tsukamurella tyrosinosolvens]KXP08844.1 hypothetical protein AXK59_00010 [Tsukamurella tyrosinosolvens]
MRALRRLAATKGYTLKKILGDDIVTVLSCETCHGACEATTFELDRGHWRGRFLVFEGTLAEVHRWMLEQATTLGGAA